MARALTIRGLTSSAALILAVASVNARAETLNPALSGLAFLVGHWSSGDGKVADTGGTATGSSTIRAEAGGGVLLRLDHTSLFDAAGKPTGQFDQIMMIYPEGGTLHADYCDGTHTIHYTSAVVDPGHSVVFTTGAPSAAPGFRLAYALKAPETLTIDFSMAPPGSADFHPIATGTLNKSR